MKRAFWCIALGLGACSEPADRPETIGVCEGGGCESASTGAQGYDSSGSSSTSTTGGSTADEGITLRGGVLVFVDDLFVGVEGWADTATILAPGAEQAVVEGEFSDGDYSVDNVLKRSSAWVLAKPADTSLISPLPVLQPLNTVLDDSYDLFMVNLEVLEEMYAGLAVQTTLASDHAQVVLRLVDANADPLPGLGIQSNEGEFIAYYDGTSWSDQNAFTDDTGLVLIGNVAAPDYPGRGIQIVVQGAEDQNFAVDVAAGAVSLAELALE